MRNVTTKPLKNKTCLVRHALAVFLVFSASPTALAEILHSTAVPCAHHLEYREEADLCPALSIQRDVERMRAFSCRILSAKPAPLPVLGERERDPLLIAPGCVGKCLEEAADLIRSRVFALRKTQLEATELRERYEFSQRIAEQSHAAYEALLARANFIEARLKAPGLRPRSAPLRCRMNFGPLHAGMVELLKGESATYIELSRNALARTLPHAEAIAKTERAYRAEVTALIRDRCVVKNQGEPEHLRVHANRLGCRALQAALYESEEGVLASTAGLAWSFFSEDPAKKFRETQAAFQKQPALRYFLLERSDVFKTGARQVVALLAALNGVSPAEKDFLESLLSEKTTDSELEFLVSPETMQMFEQLTAASDGVARLRLYKRWSESNQDLANAFRRFVKNNYEKFRALIAEAIDGAKELSAEEKALYRSLVLAPELKDPETTLSYVELLLNIATASLKDDPIAVLREISAFAWNPQNLAQVQSAKSLLRRHHAKVQAVTVEALRKYSGPIVIGGKPTQPAQMKLLETVVQKSTPEDFERVLDFALSIARDSSISGKLNILKGLAADPEALGLTRKFLIENHEVFRNALLETLRQFEPELTTGDSPPLTRQQLSLLKILVERSTGNAIQKITDFAHRLAVTRDSREQSELLLALISDADIIAETKAFALDDGNHKAFIQAALDTLRQFRGEMTHPKTGFATTNQVDLVAKILAESTPSGTAKSIDLAHDLVKSRASADRMEVLRRIAADPANTRSATDFLGRPENLELLRAAVLDTLAQQEKEIVGPNLLLSKAQYDLLRDLAKQVTAGGASLLIDYIGQLARAETAAERVGLLRALLSDPLVVKSAKDYAGNNERIVLIRRSVLDAIDSHRAELTAPGALTRDQLSLLESVVGAADAGNVKATLDLAHRFVTAERAEERLALVRGLLDEGASSNFRAFISNGKNFALLKKTTLDTLKQFRALLTDKQDGIATEDQYLFLTKIVEELEPRGTLRGIDYARAWLASTKPEAREAVIHKALTDKELLNSAAGFLSRNHALAKRALLSALAENRARLLKDGMSPKEWELASIAARESSPRDVEFAVNLLAAYAGAKTFEARMGALENYFRAHPEAGDRIEVLARGPLLAPLREVLLGYAERGMEPSISRDLLLGLIRGTDARGLGVILKHRLLVLSILRDIDAPVDPDDRCGVLDYLSRIKRAFRTHPAEIRAVFEANIDMLASLGRITLDYLENDKPITPTAGCTGVVTGPARPLKSSLNPELRRSLRAFLRGVTGQATLTHPDPEERGPLRTLLWKNGEALEKLIGHYAKATGRSPAEIRTQITSGSPIRVHGKVEYPSWALGELGMEMTREHVLVLAEFYLERIGTLLRKGQALTPDEVTIAQRQVDHLQSFLEETKEGSVYVHHIKELKKHITAYANSSSARAPARAAGAGEKPALIQRGN